MGGDADGLTADWLLSALIDAVVVVIGVLCASLLFVLIS